MMIFDVEFVIKKTTNPHYQIDNKTWWRYSHALEMFDSQKNW
jgi:hypothetical protein